MPRGAPCNAGLGEVQEGIVAWKISQTEEQAIVHGGTESGICEHTHIADSVVRQKLTRYPNFKRVRKTPLCMWGPPVWALLTKVGFVQALPAPRPLGASASVPFCLGEGWGCGLRESF